VMPFVQPSIDIGAKYFWMQLDIRNDDARQQLEAVGVIVVDDLCTKIEHARYC
jgi:predicted CoA-binding protein